jgi:hypothetical protein
VYVVAYMRIVFMKSYGYLLCTLLVLQASVVSGQFTMRSIRLASSPTACDGVVEVVPGPAALQPETGGGPFTYQWEYRFNSKDEYEILTNTNGILQSACKGTYRVTVINAFGCKITTLTHWLGACSDNWNLDILETPSSTSPAGGRLAVQTYGTNQSFTYLWSNGATTAEINGLLADANVSLGVPNYKTYYCCSPQSLRAKTVSAIHSAGGSATHQAVGLYRMPSSRLPHDTP